LHSVATEYARIPHDVDDQLFASSAVNARGLGQDIGFDFSPGRPPQVELIGKLTAVNLPGMELLTPAHTAGIAKALIGSNKNAEESLEKYGSADLSFSLTGLSRFRVNIFKQRGTHAIVMRVVPNEIPSSSNSGSPKS